MIKTHTVDQGLNLTSTLDSHVMSFWSIGKDLYINQMNLLMNRVEPDLDVILQEILSVHDIR